MGFPRNLGNLSNVLTQSGNFATMTTPPQFDNSTKLATTAFVKNSGMNFRSVNQISSGPITLTAANAGQLIDLPAGYTGNITLPLASTVPDGETFYFWSGSLTPFSIVRQGSDIIFAGLSNPTSITMNNGDDLVMTAFSGSWIATSGSAHLPYTTGAQASLVQNGYQRLPSGILMQWGTVTVAANTTSTFSFPVAFSANVYSIVGSRGVGSGSVYNFSAPNLTQYQAQNYAASSEVGFWIAIGR